MSNETKRLNVLIHGLGSLGTAIINSISKSPLIGKIYVVGITRRKNIPSNIEYLGCGKDLKISDLKNIIKEKNIDFAISFYEIYTIKGLIDFYINELKIPIIGCPQGWFDLEYSKLSCKEFMNRNGIKTADFLQIFNKNDIKYAIEKFGLPLVIKNNYLEAGFGSHICETKSECENIANKLLKSYDFCLAEKYITGEEITQQYIWDKENIIPLNPVKDFKKAKINNKEINTGGLASYTPVSLTETQINQLEDLNNNLSKIFKSFKPNFTSIFALNLMFTNSGLYTLEFNMRPGITEFETIIENLDCDLLEILWKTVNSDLKCDDIKYKDGKSTTVALAHKNYLRQKKGKHYRKIKFNTIQKDKDSSINLNFNIVDILNEKELLINESQRFLSINCTDKNNPTEKIFDYIKQIDNKGFYHINKEDII